MKRQKLGHWAAKNANSATLRKVHCWKKWNIRYAHKKTYQGNEKKLKTTIEDCEDPFGKMITSELNAVAPHEKTMAKHEISNVISKFEMMAMSKTIAAENISLKPTVQTHQPKQLLKNLFKAGWKWKNADTICYMLMLLVSVLQGNVKKSEKLMEITKNTNNY